MSAELASPGSEWLRQFVIPGYDVLAKLGEGGMAHVLLARQRSVGRLVAVKVLKSDAALSLEAIGRFQAEAHHAGSPFVHVVPVIDASGTTDLRYIVMQLMRGGSLRERLARGVLTPGQAVTVGTAVGRALHAVHGAGILHRDVKPSNILFDADGTPYLGDFGISRMAGTTSHTSTQSIVGTAEYLAPEVAARRTRTERSDIYALGVTLYEALTGSVPFPGTDVDLIGVLFAHVHDEVPPLPASVPMAIADVIMRALAKEPDARFVSARELTAALEAAVPAEPVDVTVREVTEFETAVPASATVDDAEGDRSTQTILGVVPAVAPAATSRPTPTEGDPEFERPTGTVHVPIAAATASRRPRRRRRRSIGVAVAALAAVAAAGSTIALSSNGSGNQERQSATYAFGVESYPAGFVVARTWSATADERSGTLTGTIHVSNPTSKPVPVSFDEVIPKSLARDVSEIVFEPAPTIIERDPVVRYSIPSLPAGERRELSFVVHIPKDSVTAAHLATLAADKSTDQAKYLARAKGPKPSARLIALSTKPAVVTIIQGQNLRVELVGRMSDGRKVSGNVLGVVQWRSQAPAVATVVDGVVTGVGPGSTTISATSGATQAMATVTVLGPTESSRPVVPTVPPPTSVDPVPTRVPTYSAPPQPTRPAQIASVTAVPGDTTASVSFRSPSANGSAITKYRVRINGVVRDLSGSRTVTGLHNGTAYRFAVAACNSVGCASFSPDSNAVTPYGAPSAPSVSASVNGTTITWSWNVPDGNGRPIARFDIRLDGTLVAQDLRTGYSASFGYSQTHRLSVVAVNQAGRTSAASEASGTTPPPPPPPPTVSVSWGARASSSLCGGDTSCTYVTISWANFGSGNHTITPYFDGQGDWCPSSCSDSLVRSGSSGSLTGYWAAGYCRQSHTVTATVDGTRSGNSINTIDHGC